MKLWDDECPPEQKAVPVTFKVFQRQRRAANLEPVTFEIGGQTFTAVSDIPGGVYLDTAGLSKAKGAEQLQIIGGLFDQLLIPESLVRFEAAMRSPDPEVNITLEEASGILSWLIAEAYIGRPTTPASGSPVQESTTGQPSTDDSPPTE